MCAGRCALVSAAVRPPAQLASHPTNPHPPGCAAAGGLAWRAVPAAGRPTAQLASHPADPHLPGCAAAGGLAWRAVPAAGRPTAQRAFAQPAAGRQHSGWMPAARRSAEAAWGGGKSVLQPGSYTSGRLKSKWMGRLAPCQHLGAKADNGHSCDHEVT
eukprot:366451-Chlamydomonas_euryale.AAC.7